MSEPDILHAIKIFHPEPCLVELRPIMPDGRWWTGLYDNRQALAEAIERLNGFEAQAVYWTINPIVRNCLQEVPNKLGPARKGLCTANKDIERIKWLFLDIDPKGSREAAFTLADKVRAHLAARGWSEPIHVDSGNGCYLYYPVDLDPGQKGLIKKVVNSLAERFNTELAIIDPKCVNPARIARVPGTYNRKATPRLARILEAA